MQGPGSMSGASVSFENRRSGPPKSPDASTARSRKFEGHVVTHDELVGEGLLPNS